MSTATQMELPVEIPSSERVLLVAFGEIRYKITGADPAWRAPLADRLICLRCDDEVDVLAPNAAHPTAPFARCDCGAAAFLEPLTLEDAGLLELRYPVSERDKGRYALFSRQLRRLGAPGSSEQPK
jgi:hypothetical protein